MDRRLMLMENFSPWGGCLPLPQSYIHVYFHNNETSSPPETAWPIKAKLYMDHPWEGGKKVYIIGHGHMTKMAAMAINKKKKPLQIFFSRTRRPMILKLGVKHK